MLTVEAVIWRCSEKALNLIKKETLEQVFSCECCETSKNTFSYRASPVPASVTYDNAALTQSKDVEYYLAPGPFFEA